MDNRKNGYGPLLYLLGQMMKGGSGPAAAEPKTEEPPQNPSGGELFFSRDETNASWRREDRLDLLEKFCREGCAMAVRHGHFLIGTREAECFVGIPGRFLLEEQPAGGVTGFTLWQPLAGGEELYDRLEDMSRMQAETVYGYWIARMDPGTLKLSEV